MTKESYIKKKENMPIVSIVVATFNAEKYIEDCINSLVGQTYKNIEIIICDDCSTDATPAILDKLKSKDNRIRVFTNKTNLRAAASRNKCIENSIGRYIMIQDSDDICERDRVQILLDELLQNENVNFVSSGHYLFDDDGIYKTVTPKIELPQNDDFLFGMPFCHAATMFKASCLKKVGGYRVSKETRRGQDYDLFMRLYSNGYKGKNIADVLYGYRVDKNTISRRRFKYRIDECKIRYKGFKALNLMPKGYIYVLKPLAAHFYQLINGLIKHKLYKRL